MREVELHNWKIYVEMSAGGDYLALGGQVFGHPNFRDGNFINPSTFVSFDQEQMIGTGISSRKYKLINFCPNGNADSEEKAIAWILEGISQRNKKLGGEKW